MAAAYIYLNYNGDCEEAFLFYKSVFGGEFSYLSRFKDMPKEEGMPELSVEMGNKILHVGLPIGENTSIMGSDNIGECFSNYKQGNNFSISLSADSKVQADEFFRKLVEGGEAVVPMAEAFWGDYFGMLIDKFGIYWMVIHERN